MKRHSFSMYQKFSALLILVGILPMLLITTFISGRMIEEYESAIMLQYEQMAAYLLDELDMTLDSYNTISKLPYNYSMPGEGVSSSLSFDNFRQMLYGENYSEDVREEERGNDMLIFLQYVGNVDAEIYGVHFLGIDADGSEINFHYSNYNTWFRDEELFRATVGYDEMDMTDNSLIMIAPHSFSYYSESPAQVITVARNYFDLRGDIGDRVYVGTLFLDINISKLKELVKAVNFGNEEAVYVTDGSGYCLYSTDNSLVGTQIDGIVQELEETGGGTDMLLICNSSSDYDLDVYLVMDTGAVFGSIRGIRRTMYGILGLSAAAILLGSIYFSRKLTKPIHEMMEQMAQIEQGNFDIQLESEGEDEIGVLSRRFNQMSQALKDYIDQVYKARISRTEAELTALKSQIYPHFLYNTLEIIRMTALEDGSGTVSDMIEALSEQIHYVIGPIQDQVPLEKEMDIVRKYVYLLNFRVRKRIQLVTEIRIKPDLNVPKLILQPIVENAYVHGLKKKGGGTVRIEADIRPAEKNRDSSDAILEISVMDNGVGMDGDALKRIQEILKGDAPGVKAQDNWQSIGLKNVHDRLRFLYGEAYGVEVTSTPGAGTLVTLRMPYTKDPKEARKGG